MEVEGGGRPAVALVVEELLQRGAGCVPVPRVAGFGTSCRVSGRGGLGFTCGAPLWIHRWNQGGSRFALLCTGGVYR